jgi:hypothetical protein
VLARTPALRSYAETAIDEGAAARAGYDGRKSRNGMAMDQITLAAAQLRAGARDEGLRAAHQILDEADSLHSAPIRTLLADLSDAAAPYARHHDAADLRARIATPA